jgi:hypothetical protein
MRALADQDICQVNGLDRLLTMTVQVVSRHLGTDNDSLQKYNGIETTILYIGDMV